MSLKTKALLAIVAASFLWGTAGLAKPLVRTFDPVTAAFFRFFVASIIILPFFLRERNKGKRLVRDIVPLATLSAINVILFYVGIQTSTANAATVIYAGVPLATAVLAHYLIKEKINKNKVVGIAVGMAGVLTIALLPAVERGEVVSGDVGGNLFFLLAVFVWSCYIIASRRALTEKRYSPLSVAAVSIFTSCIMFFLLSLFTWKNSYMILLVQPKNLFLIFHASLVVTILTYLLFQWALKHSSATTASLKQFLEPIFAVIFNFLFLGEQLTAGFLLGSILVLAGVFIATGTTIWRHAADWATKKV